MKNYFGKLSKHEKVKYIIGLILVVSSAIVSILIPIYLKNIIDNSHFGISHLLYLLFLFLGQATLTIIGSYFLNKCGEKIVSEYRKEIFKILIFSEVSFFDGEDSSEISGHLMNDTNVIRGLISSGISNFVLSLVMTLGIIVALFLLDWQLTLVVLATIPLLFIFIIPLSSLNGKINSVLVARTNSLIGLIAERFRNIHLIKSHTAESDSIKKVNKDFDDLFKISLKSTLLDSIVQPLMLVLLVLVVSAIFSYGAYRISINTLSIGTLISFLVYVFQILSPISNIGDFFGTLEKTKGATLYLDKLKLAKPEFTFDKDVEELVKWESDLELEFKNVEFSYGDSEMITGLNFLFKPNKKIAVVGPSGSGKSTLLKLIERFYVPVNGDITLNGISSEKFQMEEWRRHISFVKQEVQLLSASIRDNLILGLNRKPSDEELHNVLSKVNLLEKIENLPDGLDTFIGSDGAYLSGGERQRLQIARVLLRESKIILLDESTSSLDSESENIITNFLRDYKKDRIIITVAHRLSTVVDADEIYFFESGKITGVGTHEQLKKEHKRYAGFVKSQMI